MAGDTRPGLDPEKKTLAASEQDPVERAAWRWQATLLSRASELVFVDRKRGQPRLVSALRLRAARPALLRAGSAQPWQQPLHPGRALGPAGLLATGTVEGAANQEVFSTCLDHFLCPALRPGQVVIMDNLAVHKSDEARAKIQACGGRRWFLPAYSPDFNPVEHAFSKRKGFLRKAKARSRDTLPSAIAAGLATITGQDARGWFKHCEFPLPTQPF